MSDYISISQKEHDQLILLQKGLIDHVLVKNHDELNYYLVCHGNNDGTVFYNGDWYNLSEIIKEIKSELHIQYTVFIDVICCYGFYQVPYMDNGIRIKSAYPNDVIMHCMIGNNKLYLYYEENYKA